MDLGFRLLERLFFAAILLMGLTMACEGNAVNTTIIPSPIPAGNAARGRALFLNPAFPLPQGLNGEPAPGCSTCHALAPGVEGRGPSLAGVGTRAAQRIGDPSYRGDARTAEAYLWESIINPKAFPNKAGPGG